MSKKKSIPANNKDIQNIQYDLFSQFLTNDKVDASNTVELWECIPKYFFTTKQVEKLRTKDGKANTYKLEYRYRNTDFTVRIQPALVEKEDGNDQACFPGITEELVEEALKKIFSMQNYGIHDTQKKESWVKFSLSMIHKELKARGRERNRNQIKHAIDVMSSCIITLYKEGKEIWKGAILQDLVTVGRKEYLADRESYHMAKLPLFISHSINQLEYRQFNYQRLMTCNEQLSRWLYKQLIHRYIQANMLNTYHFMFSTIVQESGLLQQSALKKSREKVRSALLELKEKGIVARFEEEPRKNGRVIEDVKYTIVPSVEFISEQKAANKRHKDSMEALSKVCKLEVG